MKKKILFIFLLIPLLFTMISCGESEPKDYKIYEGYIVDKIYEPSRTYTTVVYTGKVPVTIIHHVPEKYYVVIYKNEKISKHKVTKEFYTNFEVGSYVTVGNEYIDKEKE